MQIDIKAMNMKQYDAYQEEIEKSLQQIEKKEISEGRVVLRLAAWVMKEVYKVDVMDDNSDLNPATIIKIRDLTLEKTTEVVEADIKNYKKSGTGGQTEAQISAEPAKSELKEEK